MAKEFLRGVVQFIFFFVIPFQGQLCPAESERTADGEGVDGEDWEEGRAGWKE